MMEAFEHSSLEGSNLTASINALLEDIQTKVVNVILTEHAGTQTEINAAFSKADSAVKTASSSWTAAAGKWATVSTCIEEEKGLSAEYATKVAKVEEAKEVEETKKKQMEEVAEISATLPGMTFNCNAAVDGECSQEVSTFEKSVEAKLTLLETSVQAQVKQYESAKSEYDTGAQDAEAAEASRDSVNTEHYKKYSKCNENERVAKDSFCNNARVAETSACTDLSKFEEVIAKAQGTNNELSHSDRASEYSTIMTTMCLLREVIGESVDCKQTYDIASAPNYTELDFKEKDAESLACHESDKRTLSQFTWTRPERTQEGPPAAESSYVKVTSQAMDLDGMEKEWC
jgi:hypothetical protein